MFPLQFLLLFTQMIVFVLPLAESFDINNNNNETNHAGRSHCWDGQAHPALAQAGTEYGKVLSPFYFPVRRKRKT